MIKKIFLISLVFIYNGCVGTKPVTAKLAKNQKPFCKKILKSKSLEFLEQQYTCKNN